RQEWRPWSCRLHRGRETGRDLGNIARAKADDPVARTDGARADGSGDGGSERGPIRDGRGVTMAAVAQTRHEHVGRYLLDGDLACRIDGKRENHVGVVEGLLELVHVIAQAREAMRLDDRDDAPRPCPLTRGG